LKGLKAVIAFLSIIPVGREPFSLEDVAENMYLFPLVGLFLGAIFGLLNSLLLAHASPLLAATLTFMFIEVFTGFHHIDGLLDFGDGVMAWGPPERKIAVMHDKQVGAGGYTLGLASSLVTVASLSSLNFAESMLTLILAECFAKLSMTIAAHLGASAYPGINRLFVSAMKKKGAMAKTVAATLPAVLIAVFTGKPLFFLKLLIASTLTTLILLAISNRHFKGVTGDVFGAINELSRMAALVAAVIT